MKHSALFYQGNYGIERETLRVDRNGRLAQTPHPFGESTAITRDFCENQVELITPVCSGVQEALKSLAELDAEARRVLQENGETFWLYSNPPHIENEDEIPVAAFTGKHSNKRRYREQLERRYGKRLMLFSGIHFNFSFSEEYLRSLPHTGGFDAFRDAFYLRLYQQTAKHSWLPLLLSAASPVYDRSLDADGEYGAVQSGYGSMRSSERGYWNEFVPVLRFDSVAALAESIRAYVENGLLFSVSELYLPVRLKPRGENSLDNLQKGISHIELRMFDLNPLEPLGIAENDLEFAHLLLMYLSALPECSFTPEEQQEAVKNHQAAARYDLENVTLGGKPILQKAEEILQDMRTFFAGNDAAEAVLQYQISKLQNRICTRIKETDIYRG